MVLAFKRHLRSLLSLKSFVINNIMVFMIHSSERNFALWESVIQSSKVVVSFDLYDCGVLFLDGNMPKINYKVMLV